MTISAEDREAALARVRKIAQDALRTVSYDVPLVARLANEIVILLGNQSPGSSTAAEPPTATGSDREDPASFTTEQRELLRRWIGELRTLRPDDAARAFAEAIEAGLEEVDLTIGGDVLPFTKQHRVHLEAWLSGIGASSFGEHTQALRALLRAIDALPSRPEPLIWRHDKAGTPGAWSGSGSANMSNAEDPGPGTETPGEMLARWRSELRLAVQQIAESPQQVTLSDHDVDRIAAAVGHRELITALTAVIHRAGCPGSDVERYGVVPAIASVVDEYHRTKDQRDNLMSGEAMRAIIADLDAQKSRVRDLEVGLREALDLNADQVLQADRIETLRQLAKTR